MPDLNSENIGPARVICAVFDGRSLFGRKQTDTQGSARTWVLCVQDLLDWPASKCWRSICVFLMMAVGLVFDAMAWGSIGHRIVGQVADQHLTPKAAARVSKIMGTNSLGDVANWMDQVRDTPEGKAMEMWHYQSVDACTGTLLKCPEGNCAGPKVKQQEATLRSGKGDQLKALRVLVHLIGDIHQPLHTAENGDGGGNGVKIKNRSCVDQTGKTVQCNLHTYWDNRLVKSALAGRSETVFVAALVGMDVATGSGDVDAWIQESNGLAKSSVHAYDGFSCKAGGHKISLTQAYDAAGSALVSAQLAKAGKRLATLLNDIYS